MAVGGKTTTVMTTLKDFLPLEVKKITFLAMLFLLLGDCSSRIYFALRSGVAQRLPGTPRYAGRERPAIFWFMVIFFGVAAILSGAMILAIILHWNEDRVL